MLLKRLLNTILIGLLISNCSKTKQLELIENPTGNESSLPRLFTDNTGEIFMSWVEQDEEMASLFYSKFQGDSWSEPYLINQSNEWFVNWADFPTIIAQDGNPMAVHWLKKIPGNTYSYNVEVASFKNGKLSEPKVPHSDGTATEHGFVSMTSISDSSFYLIWLDGRNMVGGHGDYGDLNSAMTLRGAELSLEGKVLSEAELDASVCECCNTSLAKTKSGLIAAYRNRTENEIRDIYVSKSLNGVWQNPEPIFSDNWGIAACPVNGPSIDVFDETVSVGWFTGANDEPAIKLSFSLDEGDSFLPPIIIDSTTALGRVDIIANNKNSTWISWMNRNDEQGQLNLKLISIKGEILEEYVITEMSPSRSSGFPQITKAKEGVLIAWTNISESAKSIKTVIIQ
ncbi:MAG: hypothetical protein BalsKO_11850 [Balneolaceae bacterium]